MCIVIASSCGYPASILAAQKRVVSWGYWFADYGYGVSVIHQDRLRGIHTLNFLLNASDASKSPSRILSSPTNRLIEPPGREGQREKGYLLSKVFPLWPRPRTRLFSPAPSLTDSGPVRAVTETVCRK